MNLETKTIPAHHSVGAGLQYIRGTLAQVAMPILYSQLIHVVLYPNLLHVGVHVTSTYKTLGVQQTQDASALNRRMDQLRHYS